MKRHQLFMQASDRIKETAFVKYENYMTNSFAPGLGKAIRNAAFQQLDIDGLERNILSEQSKNDDRRDKDERRSTDDRRVIHRSRGCDRAWSAVVEHGATCPSRASNARPAQECHSYVVPGKPVD